MDDLVLQVPVDRLQDLCNPIKSNPWGFQFSPKEVDLAIKANDLQATPRKYFPPKFTEEIRQHHIRRIAYLAINGWSDPIDIDVGVPSLGCFVSWPILDGNHRFYAALLRKDHSILATLSGDLRHAQNVLGVSTESTIP